MGMDTIGRLSGGVASKSLAYRQSAGGGDVRPWWGVHMLLKTLHSYLDNSSHPRP